MPLPFISREAYDHVRTLLAEERAVNRTLLATVIDMKLRGATLPAPPAPPREDPETAALARAEAEQLARMRQTLRGDDAAFVDNAAADLAAQGVNADVAQSEARRLLDEARSYQGSEA